MQKTMEKWNRLWPRLSRSWAILLREFKLLFGRKSFPDRVLEVPKTMRIPLRIVFYKEDDSWIAHCLEFNLLGDGPTQRDALAELAEAIVLQIHATVEHKNPSNLFSPADGRFFEMFAAGEDVATAEIELKGLQPTRFQSFQIEDCEYREYIGSAPCAV